MSVHPLALYLSEVVCCERKLQYCREIVAENQNFMPNYIFNFRSTNVRSRLTLEQFAQLLEIIQIAFEQDQIKKIFAYFDDDSNGIITLDQFSKKILPRSKAYQKRLEIRKSFVDQKFEYELQYSLHRFFQQILENTSRQKSYLQLPLADDKIEAKFIASKISSSEIQKFLNLNGKYPSTNDITIINKEIQKNTIGKFTNKSLIGTILAFNSKTDYRKINVLDLTPNLNLPNYQRTQRKVTQISKHSNNSLNDSLKLTNTQVKNKIESPKKLQKPSQKKEETNMLYFEKELKLDSIQQKIKNIMESIDFNIPKTSKTTKSPQKVLNSLKSQSSKSPEKKVQKIEKLQKNQERYDETPFNKLYQKRSNEESLQEIPEFEIKQERKAVEKSKTYNYRLERFDEKSLRSAYKANEIVKANESQKIRLLEEEKIRLCRQNQQNTERYLQNMKLIKGKAFFSPHGELHSTKR